MSTAFVHAAVPVIDGLVLHVDGNSKVTASNGTFAEPAPNAFSLPHRSTCPGATPSCLASCYVNGLEKAAADVYALYRENERVLHRVLLTPRAAEFSAVALGLWIAIACDGREFRWHVSGDVMHDRHAEWIVRVCQSSPRVQHWIYTKTFTLAPILIKARNLTVNLSADRDNYTKARGVATSYGLRVCYMSQAEHDVPVGLSEDDVIFPDYPQRGRTLAEPTSHEWWLRRTQAERRMVCPADFFGQSESARCGPCNKCIAQPAKAGAA